MANIYNQQQVSNYANEIHPDRTMAKYVQAQGQELVKEGEQQVDKAKQSYNNFMQSSWQNAMNQLANDPKYASNPQALQEQAKKLQDKMSAEIVDRDVKMDFLVNAQVKGQGYLNNAYAKSKKVEEEKYRSSLFDNIYSGISTSGISLANGMLGVGNADDLMNAIQSQASVFSGINAKNADGTYVFPDDTRRRMLKDSNSAIFNSFKGSFSSMTEQQRKKIYSDFDNGSVSLGVVKGKDGKDYNVSLKDVVDEETYAKFKEFSDKQRENEYLLEQRAAKQQEWEEKKAMLKTEQDLSDQLDDVDPSEALHILEQNEGVVSDKYYKAKMKSLLSAKGINASTRADTARDILIDIGALKSIDVSDHIGYIREADRILTNIEEKYAEGELSLADKKSLSKTVSKNLGVEIAKVGDDWSVGYQYNDAYDDFVSGLSDKSNVSKAFLDYFRAIEKGDVEYKGAQKESLVKTIIKKYNMKELSTPAYRNVYDMRDALKRGEIREGDVIYVGGQRGKAKL